MNTLSSQIESNWGISGITQVEQLGSGFNNVSYAIETSNASYVAKVFVDANAASGHAFEHELLQALSSVEMPFSIPTLLPTLHGGVMAPMPEGGFLVLMDRIPGIPAGRGDFDLTERCGQSLATLDLAMLRAERSLRSQAPITFGSLATVSPNVQDPIQAVQEMRPMREISHMICTALTRAETDWPVATATLQTQIIHADGFPPNVLHLNGTVSGIIDFEFAGEGYRAMDFAIGMIAFGSTRGTFTPIPRLLDAFAKGYLRVAPLTADELRAVPSLVLMREAHSFIHWFGRLGSNRISGEEVIERGHRLLAVQSWLDADGGDLINRLHSVQTE